MNLNKKIGFLLDSGFSPSFISTLNESKINVLYEKISKAETKETITKSNTTTYTITPDTAKTTGADIGNVNVKLDPATNSIKATEIKEKFESKAQQGLFWARCNKCKTEDCKWCKMAKEFSKSTSKKQYKDMPEKKETKEGADYLDAVKSAMVGGMKKNLNSSLINPKLKTESKINNEFKNIIEKNLKPTMNKRDLIRLIEATMGDTKEKETETETEKEEKKKTGNPFKKPKTKDDPEAKRRETRESFTQQDFMKQVRNTGLI